MLADWLADFGIGALRTAGVLAVISGVSWMGSLSLWAKKRSGLSGRHKADRRAKGLVRLHKKAGTEEHSRETVSVFLKRTEK